MVRRGTNGSSGCSLATQYAALDDHVTGKMYWLNAGSQDTAEPWTVSVAVGALLAFTVTCVVLATVCAPFVQLSWNVIGPAVEGAVTARKPPVGSVLGGELQAVPAPSDGVQDVALLAFQFSVIVAPTRTVPGLG